MSHQNIGSSLSDFLKAEGIFEEAEEQAIEEVLAWQLAEGLRSEAARQ